MFFSFLEFGPDSFSSCGIGVAGCDGYPWWCEGGRLGRKYLSSSQSVSGSHCDCDHNASWLSIISVAAQASVVGGKGKQKQFAGGKIKTWSVGRHISQFLVIFYKSSIVDSYYFKQSYCKGV